MESNAMLAGCLMDAVLPVMVLQTVSTPLMPKVGFVVRKHIGQHCQRSAGNQCAHPVNFVDHLRPLLTPRQISSTDSIGGRIDRIWQSPQCYSKNRCVEDGRDVEAPLPSDGISQHTTESKSNREPNL